MTGFADGPCQGGGVVDLDALVAGLAALDRLDWRDLAAAGLIRSGRDGCQDWIRFRANPARWVLRLTPFERRLLAPILAAAAAQPQVASDRPGGSARGTVKRGDRGRW